MGGDGEERRDGGVEEEEVVVILSGHAGLGKWWWRSESRPPFPSIHPWSSLAERCQNEGWSLVSRQPNSQHFLPLSLLNLYTTHTKCTPGLGSIHHLSESEGWQVRPFIEHFTAKRVVLSEISAHFIYTVFRYFFLLENVHIIFIMLCWPCIAPNPSTDRNMQTWTGNIREANVRSIQSIQTYQENITTVSWVNAWTQYITVALLTDKNRHQYRKCIYLKTLDSEAGHFCYRSVHWITYSGMKIKEIFDI